MGKWVIKPSSLRPQPSKSDLPRQANAVQNIPPPGGVTAQGTQAEDREGALNFHSAAWRRRERDGNEGPRRHARRGACAVGSPLVPREGGREGEGFELHRIPSTSIDQASRAALRRAPDSASCQPPENSATPRRVSLSPKPSGFRPEWRVFLHLARDSGRHAVRDFPRARDVTCGECISGSRPRGRVTSVRSVSWARVRSRESRG